jgi:adenylosuccinate lyase
VSETLAMKTQRLRAAMDAGFPPYTLLRLMAEVQLALAEEQAGLGALIAKDMEEFRAQLEKITTLANGLKP